MRKSFKYSGTSIMRSAADGKPQAYPQLAMAIADKTGDSQIGLDQSKQTPKTKSSERVNAPQRG